MFYKGTFGEANTTHLLEYKCLHIKVMVKGTYFRNILLYPFMIIQKGGVFLCYLSKYFSLCTDNDPNLLNFYFKY